MLNAIHIALLTFATSLGNVNGHGVTRRKMLLLGANHLRWPYGYATVDSLQRTEILEYIRKLQSTTGNIDFVSYQSFKILYATKLCDYGHIDRARKYIDALKYSVLNESSRAELEVLEDALVGGKPVTFEAQYSNVMLLTTNHRTITINPKPRCLNNIQQTNINPKS